ncbi:hypothetical protein D918_05345 [Trichuris suis]|nr:hypothetical protein D918_05345 [Trichuris suis]
MPTRSLRMPCDQQAMTNLASQFCLLSSVHFRHLQPTSNRRPFRTTAAVDALPMEQENPDELTLCQEKVRCKTSIQTDDHKWSANLPVYCTRPYRSVAFKTWTVGSAKTLYADRRPRLSSVGCNQPDKTDCTSGSINKLLPTARRCHSSSAVGFHSCSPRQAVHCVTPTWDQRPALSTSPSVSSMRLPRRLVKHDVLLDRSNSYQWDARIKIGSPSYGQNDCRPSQQKKSCWSRLMMTMQKLHPKAQNAFFPNSSATVRPCTPIPMQPFSSPVLSRDRGHLVPNRSGSLGAVKLPSESFITKRSHMTSGLYQLELLKEQMVSKRFKQLNDVRKRDRKKISLLTLSMLTKQAYVKK